jgi:hypothetical protein
MKRFQYGAAFTPLLYNARILFNRGCALNIKRKERAEKFKKLGAMIREQEWRDRRGEHDFHIETAPVRDPQLSSRMYGPKMRTLQFQKTSKRP